MNIDGHWLLVPDRTAPRDARRAVGTWAARRGLDHEVSHDLLLVTNEMVTRAVSHARRPVGLSVRAGTDSVTVRVTDSGQGVPHPGSAEPGTTSGRRLTFVRALSLAWGVHPTPTGKTVWARLPFA